MAMGTLPGQMGGARGTWRGSRGMRPVVHLYRHRDAAGDGAVDLTPYLTSVRTEKTLDAPAGTWALALKARAHATDAVTVSWLDEVDDDDWITIEFEDGQRRWLVMIGLVDSVRRDISAGTGGADVVTYRIRGRDIAKPLVDSELVWLPWAQFDASLDYGFLYGFGNALAMLPDLAGPGSVVSGLFRFLTGSGIYRRDGRRMWTVPATLRLFDAGGDEISGDEGRSTLQFGDVVSLARVDTELPGQLASPEVVLQAAGNGTHPWDLLRQFSNDVLNELFVDLVDVGSLDADTRGTIAGDFDAIPALTLRQRPFPASGEAAPAARWRALPETTLDLADLESVDVGRSGAERFNFFLVTSGGNGSFDPYALALAGAGAAPVDPSDRARSLWHGLPAVDLASAERHGWRRMERQSVFLNVAEGGLELHYGWTLLLRDWYALSHAHLQGSLAAAFLLPGIRIGERLRLRDRTGEEHYYVEGVAHDWRVGRQGEIRGRTSLTVTRGIRDESPGAHDGAVPIRLPHVELSPQLELAMRGGV